ncbi:hypothetical protein SAY87_012603 [Trapa incisa]|uniref:BHLH domain-containing protein n=1 Tax=Trapa incisa TaxID=236973 RepID=A0AAN7GHN7_9MYRT|nr:hypothetical protein SAY87_012603 [Trapa incisa]
MALEAVVYPQDPFNYCPNYTTSSFLKPEYGVYPFGLDQLKDDVVVHTPDDDNAAIFGSNSNGRAGGVDVHLDTLCPDKASPPTAAAATSAGGRRKRRRVKIVKNREEIENQRMTHIAVERNRRKQMNEYLGVLRSIMPPSYSQRGDQASIIGGAINFLKELEQLLQSMEAQKIANHSYAIAGDHRLITRQPPFSDFFSFPQYSASGAAGEAAAATGGAADIEVTMVESHANLKIQSRKQPKQLIKLVAGLQALRLGVLHLNVTSSGDTVLYTASVKVEEGCHLTTVDEIAAAVNQMLRRIEDEAAFS